MYDMAMLKFSSVTRIKWITTEPKKVLRISDKNDFPM